jgi:hypothetical protein
MRQKDFCDELQNYDECPPQGAAERNLALNFEIAMDQELR